MAAIVYDVVADENRDWNLHFTWFDKDNERVPLDGYGAVAEVRTPSGTLISRITHSSGINLSTTAGAEGEVTLTFPASDLNSPSEYKCEWEVVLHPNSSDAEENPVSIFRGKFHIRSEIASLTSS